MSPTMTATTTRTVTIKPALKRKLLSELKAYQELDAQAKIIEHAKTGHKTTISAIREETGEQAIEIEGFKVTRVEPAPRVGIDEFKKALLQKGVTMDVIEACEQAAKKPIKAFDKISLPGAVEKEWERNGNK